MKPMICQCCGLPFSDKMRGTNRDHSKNSDYCLNCYKDGEYREQQLTIVGMQKKLLRMAKHCDEITIEEAHLTIRILPDLKRWKMTHVH